MSTVVVQPERLPMPRCDEAALIEIVERAMHSAAPEWLFLRELRVGTGRQNGGAQRLDAFALNTLPYMAMKRVCYEMKTSRADFLSELKRPLKRRIGMRYSNEFYFVTPAELVTLAEIPPECGLVEAGYATFSEWKALIGRNAGFFNFHDLQQREEHWVLADLLGKGGHVRTVPVSFWIEAALRVWLSETKIVYGPIFRAINKADGLPRTASAPS
jgi:hypothetical protein